MGKTENRSWTDWYELSDAWPDQNVIYTIESISERPYCTNCGSLIEKTSHVFCPYCGAQLKPDICPHCGKQI